MDPRARIAQIAAAEIGTEEDARHTNRGAAIRKYKAATILDPDDSWPWCAGFVDWCVWEWLRAVPAGIQLRISDRPRTPSAFGLKNWGERVGALVTRKNPHPGDIVVYSFSHCGIVESAGEDTGHFNAIEGNTNAQGGRDGFEVARRLRNLGSVLAFVRVP